MNITIYKNTNFGNNEMVWNVPHPDYDFSVHESQSFVNVNMRFPLLTTRVMVQGAYDFNTSFYDYMIIDNAGTKSYYFISAIIAERNTLLFSVILDALTTFDILSQPISGVLVRKHDTNENETRFDYPTALNIEPNFWSNIYDIVGYEPGFHQFIESAVNLTEVKDAVVLPTTGTQSIVVPTLPKPEHTTIYETTGFDAQVATDSSRAFTLYVADEVDENVLNTVRGLSGDGAISDSYNVPQEAIDVVATGSEVTKVTGKFLTKYSALKLEIDFTDLGFTPANKAIEGMFNVTIMSLQEKGSLTFPAWDLRNSVNADNFIKLNLWCDPKPSGAPYCCPDQVETMFPNSVIGIISQATLEIKSVRGGQWLRAPLIYSTGKGEIFSTIETQLQRERADYERKVALNGLEMSQKQREIEIARADYNYESGLASTIIGSGISLLSGDFSGAFDQSKVAYDNAVNQGFINQLRALQEYELSTQKQLINMAYSNNLKNLNIQEAIRRVVPREVVFQSNESMGSYERYNGFVITITRPDNQSLQAKDMEYTLYGYPVYETVRNFVMTDNLRTNHTVFQWENPLLNIGGKNADMAREVLKAGIRILSNPYNVTNLLDNPKKNPLPPEPVIIFDDTFNRADVTGLGTGWTYPSGTWGVVSNTAQSITSNNNDIALYDLGSNAYDIDITMLFGGTISSMSNASIPMIVFHAADNSTLLMVYIVNMTLFLDKQEGTEYTTLGSYSIPGGVTDGTSYHIRINMIGSVIKVFFDLSLTPQITYTLTAPEYAIYGENTKFGFMLGVSGTPEYHAFYSDVIVKQYV